MPRSTSPPKEDAKDHKLFSRSKWKGKLFSSDSKKEERQSEDQQSQDNEIAQFLGNSTRSDDDRLLDTPYDPRNISSANSEQRSDSRPLTPPAPRNIYHPARPRQNKGLHVDFVPTAPEIIGEGGDEADSPPIAVSAKRPTLPQVTLSVEPPPKIDLPTVPKPSIGIPADVEEIPWPNSQHLSTRSQSKRLRRRSVQDIGDVHPSALKGEKSSEDEGSPLDSPVSPLSDGEDNVPYFDRPTRQYTLAGGTISPPETDDTGNSLTPRASPEPSSRTVGSQPLPYRVTGGDNSDGISLAPRNLDLSAASPRQEEHQAKERQHPRSLRKAARDIGTDAIDDFDSRVNRFDEIFRLGVTVHQDPMDISFKRWLRAALWWFLKGRASLELEVRSQMRGSSPSSQAESNHPNVSPGLKQAYVDLAKAWWIVKSITPKHPEIRRYGNTSLKSMVVILRNFGNKELADQAQRHVDLVANLKALAMSMKRNERLPPADLEIQRLDVRVLIDDASLPPDVEPTLSSSAGQGHTKLHSISMPLGDSPKFFAFSRMFGTASLLSKSQSWDPILIPCVLSLVRMKDDLELAASISSQDGKIDTVVKSDDGRSQCLAWRDVNWSTSGNFISIRLSDDVDFILQLLAQDYRALWTICDYTRKVQKDFAGRRGEDLIFETRLKSFQCVKSSQQASSFPIGPVSSCSLKLFNATTTFPDGSGLVQAGLRLMARTPPDVKSLSSLSQAYGEDAPTLFGFSPRHEKPRLSLRAPGSSTLILTFADWEQLDAFYSLFTRRQPAADELRSAPFQLNEAQISTYDENANARKQHLQDIRWSQLRVIARRTSDAMLVSPVDRWRDLRILLQCDTGLLVDHFALAPGELQMSLSVLDCNRITLMRPAQRDMFVTLTDYGLTAEDVERWRDMQWTAGRSIVYKSYNFQKLQDLHAFESLVLGFEVVFEGIAQHFHIGRKRKGVHIHKQLEAEFARIQLLKHDRSVQLVVFFKDFSYGSSMNFALKSTDVFERSDKGNEYFIRIVDAKFALPKGSEDPNNDFVSLDLPAYPAEHDDITIGFSEEAERDRFAGQVPAAVGKASRLASLKR